MILWFRNISFPCRKKKNMPEVLKWPWTEILYLLLSVLLFSAVVVLLSVMFMSQPVIDLSKF